jgi:hypothetical protein
VGEPQPGQRAVSAPPRNPGLLKLIEGKRKRHYQPDPDAQRRGFLGWHERGYLPHFDAPHVTQFVTVMLHDIFLSRATVSGKGFCANPTNLCAAASSKPGWIAATGSAGCGNPTLLRSWKKLSAPTTAEHIGCRHGRSCPTTFTV